MSSADEGRSCGAQSWRYIIARFKRRLFREPPPRPEHRINENINFSPVRLIDENGEQVGIVDLDEAKKRARAAGLDLVEIAGNARPIVCKILDYGRFLYDSEKRAKEARKKQATVEIKEVKVRPNIDDHDLETKLKNARKFLMAGKLVKLTVMFRRREMRRPENGYLLLKRSKEYLADVGKVERPAPETLMGRDLSMVLRPL